MSILSFAPAPAAPIQAKLTIGEPGDKYEEEADTVAAQVVSQINTPQPQETPASETVQPYQDIQPKISPKHIVQRQSAEGGISATPEIESSIEGARGSGQPLADSIREPMEGAFGADFSGVKIHTDATSDQLNQSIQAKAFTTGQDIFFRSGTYDPGSQGGQELLAHELTHVVQQGGGVQAKATASTSPSHYQEETQQRSSPVLESQQSLTIQRLQQKIREQAPANTLSIQDFIKLVENEEAQYAGTNKNTKLMITRLRKIFYDSDGWNNQLVPGTADIEPHYTATEVKKKKRRFVLDHDHNPQTWLDSFEIDQHEFIAKDKKGDTPEIAKHPNIKLADGSYLDIGHVLAGLDAMNHKASVGFGAIEHNVDAATWVGDLGSVLAEFWIDNKYNHKDPAEKRKQDIIEYYASSEDMLGNIDAYVIGKNFDIAASEGKKVSEILREYYLGEKINPNATKARQNRYSNFASSVGLTLESKNPPNFSNKETWVDKYATEVCNSAALYITVNLSPWNLGPAGPGGGLMIAQILADQEGGKELVNLFVKALKDLIKAEPER